MGIEKLYLLGNKCFKLIIISLSTIFFISVYSICDYYYPEVNEENDRLWWNMKCDSYLLLVAIMYYVATLPKTTDKRLKRIQSAIFAIGIGYGIANFLDRRIWHDREYDLKDFAITMFCVAVSQVNLKKLKDKAIKQFKNN